MSSRSKSASKSKSVQKKRSKSHSPQQNRDRSKDRNNRRDKDTTDKIFLTNINADVDQKTLNDDIKKLFEKYGEVAKIALRKHKNGFYYFGFVQFVKPENAHLAIKQLDQYCLHGKNMRVRQDRQNQGCFVCKRTGHYARQCPQNKYADRGGRQRSNEKYYRRSRQRNDRRYQRNRDDRRDRYEKYDKYDKYDNYRDREDDRHKHSSKRKYKRQSRSISNSSSESSYRKRRDNKEKKDRDRRRSRS